MKAYTLNHFWNDLLTGKYMIEISFALPEREIKNTALLFKNKENAMEYLNNDKLSWLKICMEHIINQAKKVTENVTDQQFTISMDLCKTFYNDIAPKSLSIKDLAHRFLKGQKHFCNIIKMSPNHEDLLNDVMDITTFCQQETK